MNLNRELKLAIYESSLDESDKEDLLNIVESTDDEEVLSDVFDILESYGSVYMEKKTREQYRIDRFKKKYDFKPTSQGSKEGTITVNGKKYELDMDVKKKTMSVPINKKGDTINVDRQTSAMMTGQSPKINLDENYFKLINNKRRDAILQQEVAHSDRHRSDIEYSKKSEREKMYKYMNDRYSAKHDDHANPREYEADRIAANKTDKSSIKRGVREYYKHVRNDNEEKINRAAINKSKIINEMNDLDYLSKKYERLREQMKKPIINQIKDKINKKDIYEGIEKSKRVKSSDIKKEIKSKFNTDADEDMKLRSKALEDKNIRDSKVYKDTYKIEYDNEK